jgi:crossover junction endodeoxyribonuclease RusA
MEFLCAGTIATLTYMIATLQLPLPPSMNTYWRNFRGRTILSQGGRDYKLAVQEYVTVNKVPNFGSNRLMAIITIFPRDRRSIDLDNRLKGLFDALQYAGVFDDDGQFDKIEIARGSIKSGGGCTIVIAIL